MFFTREGYLIDFQLGGSEGEIVLQALGVRTDHQDFHIICESKLMTILNTSPIVPIMSCRAESNFLNDQG